MADEALQSDGGSPTPAKRKKVSTSSRGVANLTADQLARKRANDREAQRAIRERTKNQIETLNARIKELESAQPYLDLQSALKQRDAALAENEKIRRELATALGILQPLAGATSGLNELAAAAERIPLRDQIDAGPYNASVLSAGREQQADGSPAPAATNGRDWHGNEIPGSGGRGWPSGSSTWEPARDNLDPSLQFSQSDERLGVDFLLDHSQRAALQNGVAAARNQSSPVLDARTRSASDDAMIDAWQTLPKSLPATCPLDRLILDFLAERTRLLQSGVSPDALVGPHYPNFDPIVTPDDTHEAHELSLLCTNIITRTLPDISRTPDQVAMVYIMFLVLRWLVDPSRETYELMPRWIRPRPSQHTTPYPHWATYLPWPQLRERVVSFQSHPPFDQFFLPYTKTLSVNWPYAQQDCLIRNPAYSSTQTDGSSPGQFQGDAVTHSMQWIINPAFETHVRDLNNWSLGPLFVETFPDLADTVKVQED